MISVAGLALPFLASALLNDRLPGWRYLPAAVGLLSAALLYPAVSSAFAGQPVHLSVPWLPSLGVTASIYVDAFSGLFAAVVALVGTAIFLYSPSYMEGDDAEKSFYRLMLFFMGSMLGVALSGDLILLFVFWEMTSLSSFLLVGLYFDEAESVRSARKAFVVTVSGGVALLAGLLIIGEASGTYSIPALLEGSELASLDIYPLALFLVLVGAGAKAAQFPLHFWLPDAMVAPTPVSAYLHSAAMVKAGVFLLGRLHPVLGGTELWSLSLSAVGLTTMVVAGVLALRSEDLKRLLAYSTASHLGLITAMFGWGFSMGGLLHLVNHASFKSALFLVAGIVMHETGARSFDELGGLWRSMPLTAAVTGVAALSMAGLPPLGGFVSKELFLEAALHEGPLFAAAAALAGLLSFLYSLKFFAGVFLGSGDLEGDDPAWMVGPAALLVVPTLVGGSSLLPGLLGPAAESVGGVAEGGGLWHGVTPQLMLSLAVFAGGFLVLARLQRATDLLDRGVGLVGPVTPDAGYRGLVGRAPTASLRLESQLEDRGLRRRLGTLALLAGVAMAASAAPLAPSGVSLPTLYGPEAAATLMVVAASAFILRVESHLTGTAVLAVVGFSVAILFVFAGAPDLALTQVVVETLTLLLMLMVVQRLPAFYREKGLDLFDVSVALLVGGAVFVLSVFEPSGSRLASFFVDKAVAETGGHNVVNVILVDFRGLDTMGEVTVVAVAALGGLMLLRRGRQ